MRAEIKQRMVHAALTLTDDEVIQIVGRGFFEKIKNSRPGGLLKAFVLCHEGEPEPNVKSDGQKKISFPRKAVQSAFEKLKNGLKFFNNHTTSTEREEFGEVVGKAIREIDGKLSTIVVGHFPKEKREVAEKSDIVSMEAIWDLIDDAGRWIADGVYKYTGIALANSNESTPGFSGSHELIAVEALQGETVEPEIREKDRDKPMSFHELRDAVNYRQVGVLDLYHRKNVVGQRRVDKDTGKSYWEEGDKSVNEYIEMSIIGPLEETIGELNRQIEALKNENSSIKQKIAMSQAEPTIMKMADNMQIPKLAKVLAKQNMKNLKIGDNPEQSYKDFLNAQVEYAKTLSESGVRISSENEVESPSLGATPGDREEKNIFLDDEDE